MLFNYGHLWGVKRKQPWLLVGHRKVMCFVDRKINSDLFPKRFCSATTFAFASDRKQSVCMATRGSCLVNVGCFRHSTNSTVVVIFLVKTVAFRETLGVNRKGCVGSAFYRGYTQIIKSILSTENTPVLKVIIRAKELFSKMIHTSFWKILEISFRNKTRDFQIHKCLQFCLKPIFYYIFVFIV